MSCCDHAGRPRHGPVVHVDPCAEIPIRLPAACQPGECVRGEIGALQPLGKLQRFGRVLFHWTDIEEEEPCSCQSQHELAPPLNLLRIQVMQGCL